MTSSIGHSTQLSPINCDSVATPDALQSAFKPVRAFTLAAEEEGEQEVQKQLDKTFVTDEQMEPNLSHSELMIELWRKNFVDKLPLVDQAEILNKL